MRIVHSPMPGPTESFRQFQLRIPGRINLIGEHTDYNGGKVLPFAMNRSIEIKLRCSGDEVPRYQSRYFVESSLQPGFVELLGSEIEQLLEQAEGLPASEDLRPLLAEDLRHCWAKYVPGCLIAAFRLCPVGLLAPRETHISLTSNLPHGAGISSSAALTTGLIAAVLTSMRLELDRPRIAREGMRVEHQFAGIRCGLMDQLAVLQCEKDALLLIDFKDFAEHDQVNSRSVRLHPNFHEYVAVLANTQVKHDLGSTPYNERRLSCEHGVQSLAKYMGRPLASPGHCASDPRFLAEFAKDGLQDSLIQQLSTRVFGQDYATAQRLAHAIMEVTRVDAAVMALEQGDLSKLTAAINASHQSLSRDYAVSCHELDELCAAALKLAPKLAASEGLKAPAILGARMTGGGFGGSTIQLVHKHIAQAFCEQLAALEASYYQRFGLRPELLVTGMESGLQVLE